MLQGLRFYFNGEWITAHAILLKCLVLRPLDRPAQRLIEVMAANEFIAPPTWKGYREISCESFEVRNSSFFHSI